MINTVSTKPRSTLLLHSVYQMGERMYATGRVYNDQRTYDGNTVKTSYIERMYVEDGSVIIETRNTLYVVVTEPPAQ